MSDLVKRLVDALRELNDIAPHWVPLTAPSTKELFTRIDALLREFDASLAAPSPAQASAKPEAVAWRKWGIDVATHAEWRTLKVDLRTQEFVRVEDVQKIVDRLAVPPAVPPAAPAETETWTGVTMPAPFAAPPAAPEGFVLVPEALLADLHEIAHEHVLPDGDVVDVSVALWAELWAQRLAAPPAAPDGCEWGLEDDDSMPGTWRGKCGAVWTFNEGGVVENDLRYCPQCGGKVSLAAAPTPGERG